MSMVHFYDMSVPVGLPDLGKPGGNPAVGANIVSNPPGMPGGNCAEFNGNNSHYDLGDIVELNAVQQFTIAFWMNQDILDQTDYLFQKRLDGNSNVSFLTLVSGDMYGAVENGENGYGEFDYSLVVSAGQWHHVVWVFDGAQTGNVNRLICYVDTNPMTLAFNGTIPATTADMSGVDAFIGLTTSSFDGLFDTFTIFNTALTNLQVTDLWNRTRQGAL